MRDSERKCDSCKFNGIDYKGSYCNCPQNSEYGLHSVYGWCEHYAKVLPRYPDNARRKEFLIKDMDIVFKEPLTRVEADKAISKALAGIGMVYHTGHVS